MAKKRILGICQHFYPELVSTGLHMTELFTGLSQFQENEIHIFCSYPIKAEYRSLNPPKKEIYKNINVFRTSNSGKEHGSIFQRLLYNLLFFFKACLYSLKKRNSYDMFLLTTDPPFIAMIPWFIKKILGKPYILIMYDVYPDIAVKLNILNSNGIMTKFWSAMNKAVYRNADKLVVIGEDMKAILQSKVPDIPEDRYALIHNWSDRKAVFPIKSEENIFIKEQKLENKKILLYSGNMGRTHNIEAILQAAIELENKLSDVIFLFIGGGKKKELVKKHIEEQKSGNVMSLPFQPFEILAHVLSAATFSFVCLEDEFTGMSVPSKSYGIMASGTAILGILRADSEISQTINKHNAGWVWSTNNEQSLAQLIEEILSKESEIQEKGENALAAFKENYDLAISVNKYNELLSAIQV